MCDCEDTSLFRVEKRGLEESHRGAFVRSLTRQLQAEAEESVERHSCLMPPRIVIIIGIVCLSNSALVFQ